MGRAAKIKCKNAKVFYRILPMEKMRWEHVKILEDKKTIYIRYLQELGHGKEDCIPSYWSFASDGVFYNNNQSEIYDTVMGGVLENVMQGNNAIILSYGQTATGKTLTTTGLQTCFEDRGLAPRVISALFKIKNSSQELFKMCICMSYVETKKMYLTDLFNPNELYDINSLKNVTVEKVQDECHAMMMLFQAEGQRDVAKNALYNAHTANGVLTFHIIIKPLNQTDPIKRFSKIHIVDLAGADTYGNLTCFCKDIFAIGNANLAKSQLEQFILILCENHPERVFVKQRLNILIQYLKDSLNAHSTLRFIGHIRTTNEDLLITISMLRFGQIIRGIPPHKLQPNIIEDEEMKYILLEQELAELKREKELNAMLMNDNLSTNISQERIKHMENVAEDYIHNKTNELVLLNVTDANTVLKVFKNLYNKLELEKNDCERLAYEKAHEDAMGTLKRPSAKPDSSLSIKSSRRSKSIKSKESSRGSESRANKKMSDRLSTSKVPPKVLQRGLDRAGSKNLDQGAKPIKRSRTSSLNITKRPSMRRKSTSSGHAEGTIVEDPLLENLQVPEEVPEQDVAWQSFIQDADYNYNMLSNELQEWEAKTKNANREYILRVKNLQQFINVVDIRKEESLKAKMQRYLFEGEQYDSTGSLILSDLEKVCEESLKKAQNELVEEQENVLKHQAELRICLDSCHAAKKIMDEQFEQYCVEKFKTCLPNVESTIAQGNEEPCVSDEISIELGLNEETLTEKYNTLMRYDCLRNLMKTQAENKIKQHERNKKWVQSCKP